MSAKIAAGLALLLALAGWGLYRQVSANGELQERLQQRQIELRQEQERVENLRLEIEERDLAVQMLQVRYDELRKKKAVVQTIVKEVYLQPEVQPWAQTAPPAAAVRAVHAAVECLWQPAEGSDTNCRDFAPSRDDG